MFDADIIVTNIDNFSSPFKNDVMDSSSLVLVVMLNDDIMS
jgi:hypothetical protein